MKVTHYAEVIVEELGDLAQTNYKIGITAEIQDCDGDVPEISAVPLSVDLIEAIDYRMGDVAVGIKLPDEVSSLDFGRWLWNTLPFSGCEDVGNSNRMSRYHRVSAMADVLNDYNAEQESHREDADYLRQTHGSPTA